MRIYNVVGYGLLASYLGLSAALAPPEIGPWAGLLVGSGYLLVVWLLAGVYLADVLHLGIAHGALEFRGWFVALVAVLNNTVGVYVDPIAWVNRHRHHHAYSDHPGDPNKLADDGFWKTLVLCLAPYPCASDFARDRIFKGWIFRALAHPAVAVASQFTSFGVLWALVGEWTYALTLWGSIRAFALWVNLVQNYWSHDRRFGSRRYHDEQDNAMNIGDWLPVTATFSACWQNNHHHHPQFLRLTHDESEYDFGLRTVRTLKALGVVKASPSGRRVPAGVALREVGL
jgi:stearoyl-CoA desaturase (Delta-9 desaturase)